MFDVQYEIIKLMEASRENVLCMSSNAIDAFARALGIKESARGRESFEQPTLVTLREEHSDWFFFMRFLSFTTKRAVIAVDEGWLEAYLDGDSKHDRPMAIDYEMIDEEMSVTEAVLHHSRSNTARLCSADLTQEHVHYCDGTSGWEMLPKAFRKRASIGVQRAGERWFWDHVRVNAHQLVAAMHKMEDEERQPSSVQLGRVTLTMGRWCKSQAAAKAA